MAAPKIESTAKAKLETLIALARLLERVERTPNNNVGAAQYQGLIRRLKEALAEPLPEEALNAILGAHPATAELYENLHYDHSGLCRSPLEAAINAETQAVQALARFTRKPH